VLAQGFVLLSQHDTDAPACPAVATVSTLDQPWDDGGFAIGVAAAERGAIFVDRPYFVGNPTVGWFVEMADLVTAAGGYCQVGNELNLALEGWAGGPEAYFAFEDAVRLAADAPERLLAMPPSPGVPGWEAWVRPEGHHAAHAYGSFDRMRGVVEWYLEHTAGDVWITECNFGAGNAVDVDAWATTELVRFLDWCATQERVRFVAYFAWAWGGAPPMPTPVDARGTAVETVIRDWTPPMDGGAGDIVLSVPTETAIASPANYGPGRARTIGVVLHTTRGGGAPEDEYGATVAWFRNPAAGVSAHLVVGSPAPDRVARCVHDEHTAWHARTANADHLGIEVCQSRDGDPISDFAYAAAAEACRLWAERYGFPLARVYSEATPGLVGHEDTESGRADGKTDPGGAFDWDRFLALCTGAAPAPPDEVAALRDQLWVIAERLEQLGHPWFGQNVKSAVAQSKGEP
jgi:N-acetylmuramoyl-L-alanine amidase